MTRQQQRGSLGLDLQQIGWTCWSGSVSLCIINDSNGHCNSTSTLTYNTRENTRIVVRRSWFNDAPWAVARSYDSNGKPITLCQLDLKDGTPESFDYRYFVDRGGVEW